MLRCYYGRYCKRCGTNVVDAMATGLERSENSPAWERTIEEEDGIRPHSITEL